MGAEKWWRVYNNPDTEKKSIGEKGGKSHENISISYVFVCVST